MSQDHTRLPPTRGEGQGQRLGCDCLNRFNEQLRPHNVMIEEQAVRTWFDGDQTGRLTQRVLLKTAKLTPSRDRKTPVFPNYCPFCGERYIAEPAPEGVATTPTADGEASKPKARATEPKSSIPANHTEESKP